MEFNFNLLTFIVVLAVVGVAVTIDIKTRRIPNWLTVPTFVAGLLYHIITGGWSGLGFALGGFGVGFGILLILWLIGGGGGGDVKLMGAIGAWLGAPITIIIFIGSALFALICTVVVLAMNQKPATASPNSSGPAANIPAMKQTIPYAVPVAMTIVSVFLFFMVKS